MLDCHGQPVRPTNVPICVAAYALGDERNGAYDDCEIRVAWQNKHPVNDSLSKDGLKIFQIIFLHLDMHAYATLHLKKYF